MTCGFKIDVSSDLADVHAEFRAKISGKIYSQADGPAVVHRPSYK